MASQRPGFARTNTERAESSSDIELQQNRDPGVGKSNGNYEFNDPDVKNGTFTDIKPADGRDESPPDYEDGGDGFAKVTEPVESAKDLITQVLHVDDDPTLSPYTFRVFFLGKLHRILASSSVVQCAGSCRQCHVRVCDLQSEVRRLLNEQQALVSQSSAPSSRRSSTSSRKPSTSASSSSV